jgi:hypothetical protein
MIQPENYFGVFEKLMFIEIAALQAEPDNLAPAAIGVRNARN